MTEHLTEQEIELYRRPETDSGDRQIIAAHLAVCRDCLTRILESDHSGLAFNSLTEAFLPAAGEQPFHLSPAELKSYSTGAAVRADRIICESHIDICARCSEELRLLSAAAPVPKAKQRTPKWSWQAAASFAPARVAAAIALVGLLVFGIVLWRQRSTIPTPDESARNNSPETRVDSSSPLPSNSTASPLTQPDDSNQSNLASLKDNDREIRLDEGGKLTGLEEFDESAQKMARAVLAGETLGKPNVIENLSSPPIKLLGQPDGDGFQLIGPLGRVVTEKRPSLKWRELNGATSYVVSVFDHNFNRVAQSPPLSKPVWNLAVPLQGGQTYSWEVTAVKDGKEITAPVAPAPRAQFRVLEADKLNTLTKLKGQRPTSHLALGLTYARFGLVPEAETEFRRLVKENPDSALAKKLLRTVQAWVK